MKIDEKENLRAFAYIIALKGGLTIYNIIKSSIQKI
jgi:hypothetical protein